MVGGGEHTGGFSVIQVAAVAAIPVSTIRGADNNETNTFTGCLLEAHTILMLAHIHTEQRITKGRGRRHCPTIRVGGARKDTHGVDTVRAGRCPHKPVKLQMQMGWKTPICRGVRVDAGNPLPLPYPLARHHLGDHMPIHTIAAAHISRMVNRHPLAETRRGASILHSTRPDSENQVIAAATIPAEIRTVVELTPFPRAETAGHVKARFNRHCSHITFSFFI